MAAFIVSSPPLRGTKFSQTTQKVEVELSLKYSVIVLIFENMKKSKIRLLDKIWSDKIWSDKIIGRTKLLVGQNYWSDKILVTDPKNGHFCPTKFCPIRYSPHMWKAVHKVVR